MKDYKTNQPGFCRYQNADWRIRPLPVEMIKYGFLCALYKLSPLSLSVYAFTFIGVCVRMGALD